MLSGINLNTYNTKEKVSISCTFVCFETVSHIAQEVLELSIQSRTTFTS